VRTKFPFLYSLFNKIRRDIYLLYLRLFRRADDPKEVFSFYFERNLFGDPDSLSGTGSSLAATETIRSALPALLATLNMRVILDVPCGDFNWAKEVDWKPFHYIGADIVSGLVERNRALYASDEVEFLTFDILTDPLPRCDLILCRDLFIHFPNDLIQSALQNISRSGARYFLTTQYEGVKTNRDIRLGSFRPVNLMLPPFCLPKPEQSIPDNDYLNLWGRTLALWRLDQLDHSVESEVPGLGMER
jgi:hypothetical protein